jgi:AraC-like DNA-binding protein
VRQSEAEAEPSEDRNLQWAHTVRSYIESCYADAALSAGMIADYLQMNLSTLSRRYKSVMGHGVLDEIHLVRLAHAKELLLEGKTVRETAEQIGYVEARSLVRAFKRYEEVTPTEFVQAHIA